jgi:DNA polymerase III gamma/tau subunit
VATKAANILKSKAEDGVRDAKIKLDKALAMVYKLTPAHVNELKVINIPTPTVKLCVKAIMIMLEKKPDKVKNEGITTGKNEEVNFIKWKKTYKNPKDFRALLIDFAENKRTKIPEKVIKKLES